MVDTSFKERLTPKNSRICFDEEEAISGSYGHASMSEYIVTASTSRPQQFDLGISEDRSISERASRSAREFVAVASGVGFIIGLTVLTDILRPTN